MISSSFKMIKLAHPDITAREVAAVTRVLRSGTLSLGPELAAFEQAFARYVGRQHALAVSSGTAALHLAVRALGLKAGDQVITSPYSFIASVNCILFEGARPVLADIDPVTMNIDPDKAARLVNARTKAILAVDVFGLPAEYRQISAICRQHGLHLIEDSCEALGAEYHGGKAGSFGTVSTFGFYPNKQITTGEGGMVLCDDDRLHQRMSAMRNQGRSSMGGWLAHHILGYNYRMADINAALGRVQLQRLPRLLENRRRIADNYQGLFAKQLPEFTTLHDVPGMRRSWFVFAVLVPEQLKGKKRDQLIKGLQQAGVGCAHYFPALHLQPALRSLGYRRGDFPVAEDVADRSFAIPFHHKLTLRDQQTVVRTIKRLV
jgi:perosamine synthetase